MRCADEAATQALARQLAGQAALRQALVELRGDLGAGKTTLVRHVLQALGVQGRIKSPTYAVVEPYTVDGLPIWHFDFYRFNDPQEWEDAGFRDIFASPGLKLVEWPDKAGSALPPADLQVDMVLLDDDARRITFTAQTQLGGTLLEGLSE
jgi:tRNA threonylcarbamoyladenosine biosynthesis protein TsaE